MVHRRIFDAITRPNSCIINFYTEGDCIPIHIDSHDFSRPFVTLSLLSEQSILFGAKIQTVGGDGEFKAPRAISLPTGSVLVLDGNGADVANHCVPSITAPRISITFRKIGPDAAKRGCAAYEGAKGVRVGVRHRVRPAAPPPAASSRPSPAAPQAAEPPAARKEAPPCRTILVANVGFRTVVQTVREFSRPSARSS